MIINTNPVKLFNVDVTLETTYISAFDTRLRNDKAESVKADCQVGIFATPENVLIGEKRLNIENFDEKKQHAIFDYPVTDNYPFYFFDVKIKEHLMKTFPEWDEAKLVITTEPVTE